MIDIIKYLKITLPVLYIGLEHNWLNTAEVVALINENWKNLNCDEKILMDVNVNDDRENVLGILRKYAESKEFDAIKMWQLAHLIFIEQSNHSIHDKLREIELLWTKFDYPESWRGFIYYMPTEQLNTEESVYNAFLTYLNEERKLLNI